MSLIHWWPLNGDTEDKITGAKGSLIASGNINETGKIGKCYSSINNHNFTTATWSCGDGISVSNCNLVDEVLSEYSFSCWFLVHGNHGQYQSCIMSSGDWNQGKCWVIGLNQTNTTIFCPVNNYNSASIPLGYTLTSNKWYHLVTVHKNDINSVYLDGEFIGSVNARGIFQSTSADACIGRDQAHGGFFPFNGDINDLRIYNHALSVAEIKELKKGLMIHFPLTQTTIESTTNVNGGTWSAYESYWKIKSQTKDSIIVYRPSGSTNTVLALSNSTVQSAIDFDTTYTLSCYLFVDGNPYKSSSSSMSTTSYGYYNSSYESRDDGYYRCTFTKKSSSNGNAWIFHAAIFGSIGTDVECEIRDLQIEKKDHATLKASPSRNGVISNETGFHTGETVNSLEIVPGILKGRNVARFDGVNSCIDVPINKSNIFTTDYTLNFWVYPTDSGRAIYFGDYSTNGCVNINFERTSDGSFRYYHDGTNIYDNNATSPVNSWTMLTVVYTPGTMKIYKNGVLKSTNSHTATLEKSSGFMRIGRDSRSNDSDKTPLGGYMSDFRFYTTALSETDILELYKTSAYISNKGDFLTGEIIENGNEIMVQDSLSTIGTGFHEFPEEEYETIEYIQSSGSQYIDTGWWWHSEKAKVIADIMITSNTGYQTPFGNEEAVPSNLSSLSRYFGHILHGSGYNFAHYIGNNSAGSSVTLTQNTRFRYHYESHGDNKFSTKRTTVSNNETTTINNNVGYSGSIRTKKYTTNSGSNLAHYFIFSNHNLSNGTGAIQNIAGMRVYRFTMYDNGDLVRDFIPVKRKSDGSIGLYDLAMGGFYLSPNGVAFTAGANVSMDTSTKILKGGSLQTRELIEI